MTDLATVAANLRAIEDMALRLEDRAIDRSNSRDMPGGDALVNLGGTTPRRWAAHVDEREQAWLDDPDLDDADMPNWSEFEDPDELWPAVQILAWWSEEYRQRLDMKYEGWRPTLVSEAKFLRNHDVAEWIWNNEVHWDDYAGDVSKAKTKLENILIDGERAERGVPCLYEACRGARLVRKLEPYRDKDGGKAWRHSDWHCPKCHRKWDEDQYARNVTAAHERAKVEQIPTLEADVSETWCSYDYAARKVGRPAATIRAWVKYTRTPRTKADHEHPIATACIVVGRRTSFVRLADVLTRHEASQRRKRAA